MNWLGTSLLFEIPEIFTQDDVTPTNSDDEERVSSGAVGVFNLLQKETDEQVEPVQETEAHDQTHEKLLDMISCQTKV